jgi:DNA-binding IclR family transcriptional regulator
VAAPVYNHSRKTIAAISISGPTNRMKEKNLEKLISLIKNTAREISRQLGFNEEPRSERPIPKGKAVSQHA